MKIGFWTDAPTTLATDNQDYIIRLLKAYEITAFPEWETDDVPNYRYGELRGYEYLGYHKCLICGERAGCREYCDDIFTWPSGYTHYLMAHNIKIDDGFKKYIMGLISRERLIPYFKDLGLL